MKCPECGKLCNSVGACIRNQRDRYKAALEFIRDNGSMCYGCSDELCHQCVARKALDKPEIKRSCNEAHPGQDVHHPEGH